MADWRAALRLMLITDGAGDVPRLLAIVRAALVGGVRCVQVREPRLTTRELIEVCEELRPPLEAAGGLLLVNDAVAVAAAGHAHGVHLGQRSLPVATTRRIVDAVRPGVIVGLSVHDERELLAATGADYVAIAPVFPTRSHPERPPLGPRRAAALAALTPLPAVWLGGIDRARLAEVRPFAPAGIAVLSAIMAAPDPRTAAAELVAASCG